MEPNLTVSPVSSASSTLVPARTNLGRLRIPTGHVDPETASVSAETSAAGRSLSSRADVRTRERDGDNSPDRTNGEVDGAYQSAPSHGTHGPHGRAARRPARAVSSPDASQALPHFLSLRRLMMPGASSCSSARPAAGAETPRSSGQHSLGPPGHAQRRSASSCKKPTGQTTAEQRSRRLVSRKRRKEHRFSVPGTKETMIDGVWLGAVPGASSPEGLPVPILLSRPALRTTSAGQGRPATAIGVGVAGREHVPGVRAWARAARPCVANLPRFHGQAAGSYAGLRTFDDGWAF